MTPPHPKVVHETCSQVEVGRCVCRFLRQLGLCVEEGLPSGLVGNVCRNHVQPLARSAWCTRLLYKGMRHMWLSEFTAILLVGKKGLRCLVWLAMAEGVHTSLRRRIASNVFYTACILDTLALAMNPIICLLDSLGYASQYLKLERFAGCSIEFQAFIVVGTCECRPLQRSRW